MPYFARDFISLLKPPMTIPLTFVFQVIASTLAFLFNTKSPTWMSSEADPAKQKIKCTVSQRNEL